MRSGEDFPIPDEQYRIEHYTSGELPILRGDFLVVEYEAGSDCIEKVRAVVALIAPFSEQMDNWPSDEYWRQTLPKWLLDNFREYTAEEAKEITQDIRAGRLKGHFQWQFSSWVYSMMEREWQWWSIATNDTQFTLYFTMESWPYSIGALKELIYIAGGRIIYEF